jgi:hypothetical protein
MTIFDLLFLVLTLTALGTLATAAVVAMRGRVAHALGILHKLGVCAAIYFGVVIVVSIASPQRVLQVGEPRCFDDWCLCVETVQSVPAEDTVRYTVGLRVFSRARHVSQRARDSAVYLTDDQGRRYDPLPDPRAIPLRVLLQPQQSVRTVRVFELPADARGVGLAVDHSGFPGDIIIGDDSSLFHRRTIIRLP